MLHTTHTVVESVASAHTYSFRDIYTRLQDLGYLPVTPAFIHEQHDMKYIAFFKWPVPKMLQEAADRYPWNPYNPFFRGAIIPFERYNGILHHTGMSEGRLHAQVIKVLMSSSARPDPVPWQWVIVSKSRPESLHVWQRNKHTGKWVWHTVVNTGVMHSTPSGTWPIYQRLPVTTMIGEFPYYEGGTVHWQHYDDPGIKWVNYFDAGRGIHYYPRASYGFPQSAGCVEEPLSTAEHTYDILHYGVPVTVTSQPFSYTY